MTAVRTVVGIDPGLTGGLALLSLTGELIEVARMPTLADGAKGRRTICCPLLADMLRRWSPAMAYIELVNSRPGEGASSAFSFGRCRGALEGVAGALGVRAQHVAPVVWKRALNIPPGRDGVKDLARSVAINRWPAHAAAFARKADDGVAEAALIAIAGLQRYPVALDAAA